MRGYAAHAKAVRKLVHLAQLQGDNSIGRLGPDILAPSSEGPYGVRLVTEHKGAIRATKVAKTEEERAIEEREEARRYLQATRARGERRERVEMGVAASGNPCLAMW